MNWHEGLLLSKPRDFLLGLFEVALQVEIELQANHYLLRGVHRPVYLSHNGIAPAH